MDGDRRYILQAKERSQGEAEGVSIVYHEHGVASKQTQQRYPWLFDLTLE